MSNNKQPQAKAAAKPEVKQAEVVAEATAAITEATEAAEQAPEATAAPQGAPAATEEPTPTPAPTPEPTPEPTPAPTEAPAPVAAPAPTAAPVQDFTPENVKILKAVLDSYVENMDPRRPENVTMFNAQQVGLWTTLYRTIEREDDFQECMGVLLSYFREHNHNAGVFHGNNVFRAMDTVPLDADRIRAFQNIVTVLQVAAGSVQLGTVKNSVDLNRAVMEGVFSDAARNRVFGYFGK